MATKPDEVPAVDEAGRPLVVLQGNAYRLLDGSLQSCALLADGRISGLVDPDEWYEVGVDDEQVRAARMRLRGAG